MAPTNRFFSLALKSVTGVNTQRPQQALVQTKSSAGESSLKTAIYNYLGERWMRVWLPAFWSSINVLYRNTHSNVKWVPIFSSQPIHLSALCHNVSQDFLTLRHNSVHLCQASHSSLTPSCDKNSKWLMNPSPKQSHYKRVLIRRGKFAINNRIPYAQTSTAAEHNIQHLPPAI